jgi:hypothetical protein
VCWTARVTLARSATLKCNGCSTDYRSREQASPQRYSANCFERHP